MQRTWKSSFMIVIGRKSWVKLPYHNTNDAFLCTKPSCSKNPVMFIYYFNSVEILLIIIGAVALDSERKR